MIIVSRRNVIMAALCAAVLAAGSAAAQAPSGKLVLYTSQPERDAAQTVAAFKRAQPGVEVDVFRSGTTEVMGKLAAEFAAGAAQGRRPAARRCRDHGGAEEGRPPARRIREAKVDGLEPGAVRCRPHVFRLEAHHHRHRGQHRGEDAGPTSWADLAKPEYKGQIAMPSPLYSGAAAIMLGTMTERPDLGWSYFEKLKAARRGRGARQRRRGDRGRERREVLRRAGRFHGVQREGQGLADRLHLSRRKACRR